MKGRLRFGAADDLAITQLPRILRHFRQLYPQINLELTVNQSGPLRRRLEAGHLDLIFIKQSAGDETESTRVARDSMVWVGQEKMMIEDGAPVPLIAYQGPSLSRQMAIEALEAAGRTWRITCNTRDVNGVLAAVRAGMGVAVFPQALIPADLVKVSNRFTLPELGDVDYVLMANPAAAQDSVEALKSAIVSRGVSRAA
jgi:DNA-binding transcriptional LysR family regulator